MSAFSEYFKKLLQDRETSISKLSRETGVERTAIHKAISGERILSYHALEQMISYLQLSPEETNMLRRHYDRLFENETAEPARKIIDRMFRKIALAGCGSRKPAVQCETYTAAKASGEAVYVGYEEINRAVWYILSEELQEESPEVEMAIPAGATEAENILAALYRSGKHLEVSHIVCFETENSEKKYNLHNLKCLSRLIPVCISSGQQYQVFYYYESDIRIRYADVLPYYMITHNYVLCFAPNCQTAIFLIGKDQTDYFRSCFYNLKKSCCRMVEYERNPSSYLLQHLKGNVCAVMQTPWFGSPDMERSTIIFTKKGVLDFLAMKKYMLCEEEISKSRRLRELKQLIDKIREEAIQGRMMNEAMFTMPDGIALFAAETESLLVYMGKEAESLWIREKNLSDALYHWAKHLYEGNGVFDKNTTLEILTGILEV